MIDATVAARYARALFIVTEKRGETAQALEDLKASAELLQRGSRVGGFFFSPEIRLPDKRDMLRKAFDGKALKIVAVFVDLLLRKKRLAELPAIATEYQDLVEKKQGVHRATVVSATALSSGETTQLVTELERITGGKVRLTAQVDPSVIGGVVVRIGDRVIDRTARTLLETIHKQLLETSV